MEATIIKIGKSKGFKLSKPILDKYNIKDKIDMELKKDCIILKPIKSVREGWDEAFSQMRENNDDLLLAPDVFPEEGFEKW